MKMRPAVGWLSSLLAIPVRLHAGGDAASANPVHMRRTAVGGGPARGFGLLQKLRGSGAKSQRWKMAPWLWWEIWGFGPWRETPPDFYIAGGKPAAKTKDSFTFSTWSCPEQGRRRSITEKKREVRDGCCWNCRWNCRWDFYYR